MKQSFTLNQCLRMLYGETSVAENYMLNDLIASNPTVRDEFRQMQAGFRALGKPTMKPADDAIENIMSIVRKNTLRLSI